MSIFIKYIFAVQNLPGINRCMSIRSTDAPDNLRIVYVVADI